jgi:formate hydrogenlyase subunit 6/NADH:ubiquinone oxidoreductase subunit I
MKQLYKAFGNLLKKPQTIDYPATPIVRPVNYRGLIEYGEPSCIYCLKCEKACPPKAIHFVATDTPSKNPKNKKSLAYAYNPWLCIYCGECVRACPKPEEALWQSEKKPGIATAKDRPNEAWDELEGR